MKKHAKMKFVYMSIGCGLVVLALSTMVSIGLGMILENGFAVEPRNIVLSCIESVVGAVSTGFVVYQLKSGEDLSKHQNDVEKAEFILEYNRSFVENEKMTEMERYMECKLTGADYGEVSDLTEHRQDMVNYLVYLEGLASCILDDILDFDHIDDLFAYRFFLAMNHPEVQSIDLLPYATYYRGCFRLYDKWLRYRMKCGKYDPHEKWDIPLFDTALCNHLDYEKYACPDIKVEERELNCIRATDAEKKWAELSWDADKNVTVRFNEKVGLDDRLLRVLLKELIYKKNTTSIKGCKKITDMFEDLIKTRDLLYQDGVYFRQLNNKLSLTEENLRRIAKLIYQTDLSILICLVAWKTQKKFCRFCFVRAGTRCLIWIIFLSAK